MSAKSDDAGAGARYSAQPSDARELHPVSGRRALPAQDWREQLLALACSLPVHETPRLAARLCVDTLAELLPDLAVGVVIAGPVADAVRYARTPDGAAPAGDARSARLFPQYTHESVLELDSDLPGCTLHVASRDGAAPAAPDGESLQIATRAASVLSAALRRSRFLQQARQARDDMSRMQAQIIQAEKLASLGQLVAGVIHELNNPLTSIVAYSDYLKKKAQLENDADDLERLNRIQEAAQRVLEFSRHLVTYARPAAMKPEPVSLPAIVEKALMFCEHEFAENAVVVTRDYAAALPPVHGVTGQLIQVFVNLFTNAAHAATERGGRLSVNVREEPQAGMVVTEVTDDGQGIAPPDLERIFEPFFTTKADGHGTGLGLSIVREIVVSHGGSLTARSALGLGTTFVVVLPKAL